LNDHTETIVYIGTTLWIQIVWLHIARRSGRQWAHHLLPQALSPAHFRQLVALLLRFVLVLQALLQQGLKSELQKAFLHPSRQLVALCLIWRLRLQLQLSCQAAMAPSAQKAFLHPCRQLEVGICWSPCMVYGLTGENHLQGF